MALRMVHDHMRSYEAGRLVMKINKELCQSAGKSRQLYQEYLEEQKKQRKQTEKDLKRKIVGEEIKDIQKKRKFWLQLIMILVKMQISMHLMLLCIPRMHLMLLKRRTFSY